MNGLRTQSFTSFSPTNRDEKLHKRLPYPLCGLCLYAVLSLFILLLNLFSVYSAPPSTYNEVLTTWSTDSDDEPSKGDILEQVSRSRRLVIHSIEFVIIPDSGTDINIIPSRNELLGVISSRQTDFSLTSRILRSIAYEAIENKGAPSSIKNTLLQFYATSSQNEIRWFNSADATNDVLRLQDFFIQRGFHDATARYLFAVSDDERNNTLTYTIRTRSLYNLGAVTFKGLDSIPKEIQTEILNASSLKIGEPFQEQKITQTITKMIARLRDFGYAYAGFDKQVDTVRVENDDDSVNTTQRLQGKPVSKIKEIVYSDILPIVSADTVRKVDSVTVFFKTGNRYKFGEITFIDSTRGFPFVRNEIKRRQLEFNKGDWYNQTLLDKGVENIRALGTFDRVSLLPDTTQRDSAIDVNLFTQYRRASEFNVFMFFNNTIPDNFNNLGVEANILHRNFLGDAQSISGFVRTTLRNTGFFASTYLDSGFTKATEIIDYDIESGLQLAQPDFFRFPINNRRVDFSFQALASYRRLFEPFSLLSLGARGSLAMPLPSFNFINRIQADLSLEFQRPDNFNEARQDAVRIALERNPGIDTSLVREALDQYSSLDVKSKGGDTLGTNSLTLASAVLGVSLVGDQRNDFFNPTKGYLFNAVLEGTPIPGSLAKFIRMQVSLSSYTEVEERSIVAWRARMGHIYWWDRDNSIVPFDRHYFAGGASSIRSYNARVLRDPNSGGTITETGLQGTLANFIGLASIVELSAEYRYTFPYVSDLGEFLAKQVSSMGITGFIDAGNAFNRLTPDFYGKAGLTDILNPVNWGWGIGVGLRYATPIGPFRADFAFPFYDPLQAVGYKFIFNRSAFDSMVLQISIAHAF
jgi:outer membrane protein assembly factor BamA